MQKIENAIDTLAGKIVQSTQPDEAMKISQSVLNLAHAKNILTEGKKPARSKASS